MRARKHVDISSAALPVLDMAHVKETIELHRSVQEIVRRNRKKRMEHLKELAGKV